ncbi:IclR family transcriptional regulator [Sphingomonas sp.]|uniref:IclR family transcriptional regulator n=1 Tax=Sphingomonas sp. TaxID=28214 RepID=UPI0031D102E9
MRGLDVIEALADGPLLLADLSGRLGLTRSTTHRLAVSLVERGYLVSGIRSGYRLGPKLLELGFRAQDQFDLVQVAHAHLERLADQTDDTVHLGTIHGDSVRYLDKITGRRRINISSRIGDAHLRSSTGLGKALMLDLSPEQWQQAFAAEQPDASAAQASAWLARMADYAARGIAFDLEENEDRIRCVAAPVRDGKRHIVGAISVSGAAHYMSDDRMADLVAVVRATAFDISRDLGCTDSGEE